MLSVPARSFSDSQVPKDLVPPWVPISETNMIRLLMDNSYTDHPYLIGPDGRKCRQLTEKYNVKIHFPDMNRFEGGPKINHVMLFGKAKNVEDARREMRQRLPIRVATCLLDVENPKEAVETAEIYIRMNDRPVTWRFADDNSSCVFKTELRSADYLNETFAVCVRSQKRHSNTEMYQVWAPVLAIINGYNEEISLKLLAYIYEKTGATIFYSPPVPNMCAAPYYFIQASHVEGVVSGYNYLLGLTSMQIMFVVPYSYTSSADDCKRWMDKYLVDVRFEVYRDENVNHDVKRAVLRFLEFCLPHAYTVRSEILGLRSTVQCTKYDYMDELRKIITSDVFKTCKIFFPTSVSERDFQKSADTKASEEVFAGFYQKDWPLSSSSSKEFQNSCSSVRSSFNPSLSTACESDLIETLELEIELNNFTNFLKNSSLKYRTNYFQMFAEACATAKVRRASSNSDDSEVQTVDQSHSDDEMFTYYVNRTCSLILASQYHFIDHGDALVITAPKGTESRNSSGAEAVKDKNVMPPLLRKVSVATNGNSISILGSSDNISETDPEPLTSPRRMVQSGGFVFCSNVPKLRKKTSGVVEKSFDDDCSYEKLEEANNNNDITNNNNNEFSVNKHLFPIKPEYVDTADRHPVIEKFKISDDKNCCIDENYNRPVNAMRAYLSSDFQSSPVPDVVDADNSLNDTTKEDESYDTCHAQVIRKLFNSFDNNNHDGCDKLSQHAAMINALCTKDKELRETSNRHVSTVQSQTSFKPPLIETQPDLNVLRHTASSVSNTLTTADLSKNLINVTDKNSDAPVEAVKALFDAHRRELDAKKFMKNSSSSSISANVIQTPKNSTSSDQCAYELIVGSTFTPSTKSIQRNPVSRNAVPECFAQHMESAHTRPDVSRSPIGSSSSTRSNCNQRKESHRKNSKSSPGLTPRLFLPNMSPMSLSAVLPRHLMSCSGTTNPNSLQNTMSPSVQSNLTSQVHVQPGVIPHGNVPPGIVPQGGIQPGLASQINPPFGIPPQSYLQPCTIPQSNVKRAANCYANAQPDMLPQGNVQPRITHPINIQPGMGHSANVPFGVMYSTDVQPPMIHQENVQPNMYMYPPISIPNVQYSGSSVPIFDVSQSGGFLEIRGLPPNVHLLPLPQYVYPVASPLGVHDGNNVTYYQMCTPNGNVAPHCGIQGNPVQFQQTPVIVPSVPSGMVYMQDPNMQYYNGGAPSQYYYAPPTAIPPFMPPNYVPVLTEQYHAETGELVDEVFGPEYLYDDPNTLFVIVNPSELPPMCAVLLEIGRFQYMNCLVYTFMIPMETYCFFKRIPVPGRVVVKGESHIIPYSISMPPKYAFDVQFVPYVEEREAIYVPNTFPKPLINFPAPKSLQAAQEFIAITYGFDVDETFMQMNLSDGTPTFYHINRGTHSENQWDMHPSYGGPVQQNQYSGMRVV